MGCYGMAKGSLVKVTKIKPVAEKTIIAGMLEKIRENIRKGLPAVVDQTGTGPGHKHQFRWPNVSVAVEDVEYVRVYVTGQQYTAR